jgi:[ribosomal protein S18]-alanine N-acetyltransferase
MSAEVRIGSVADVDAVMLVMREAFNADFGEAWSRDQCLAMLSLPGTSLGLAEVNGTLLGFAMWRAIFDECELLLIAVDPFHRRLGVAHLLFEHAVTESKAMGCKKLYVEVRIDNPAVAFYQKQGFAQSGVRNNYYRRSDGGPSSALTMHKLI